MLLLRSGPQSRSCPKRVADGTICHEGASCHSTAPHCAQPGAPCSNQAEGRYMTDGMSAEMLGPGGLKGQPGGAGTGGWPPSQIAVVAIVSVAGLMVSLTMSVLI